MRMTTVRAGILWVTLVAPTGCVRHTMPKAPADGSSRWAIVGEPAPEIALRSLDGGTRLLSSFIGSVVVVAFWSTFCGPCRDELSQLEIIQERHRDLNVLAISLDDKDSDDAVQQAVTQLHLNFPILRDPDGHVTYAYMKYAMTPLTVVVGRDGRVRALHRGYVPALAEQLEREVQTALGDPRARETSACEM
jgi:peroxiredoxin